METLTKPAAPAAPEFQWDQCEGCGKEGYFMGYDICWECTKARARAAMDHRCRCGHKAKPTEPKKAYSRIWIACQRCLGTIRQLN